MFSKLPSRTVPQTLGDDQYGDGISDRPDSWGDGGIDLGFGDIKKTPIKLNLNE